MFASKSQNLPGAIEQAAAMYRDAAAQLPPVSEDALGRLAEHLAAGIRFSLDEPQGMRRLHEVTAGLNGVSSFGSLLPTLLDGALWLTGADFGNIQLLNPITGSLGIVTQSGFGSEFLDHFAVVDDSHSACGRAAQASAQAVIADVTTDPGFAPHRDIAAAAGFRSVQSTPLVDWTGRLIGMVSTHFQRPDRPSSPDLQIMELYGYFAGEAVAGHLGVPADDDLVGWSVISALLNPGNGQTPKAPAAPGPGDGLGDHERIPVRRPASVDETMSEFAGDVVNCLFSVGRSLEAARSIVGEGPAGDRVTAATDELDRMIRDIREIVFTLVVDRGQRPPRLSPNRWTLPPA